MPPPPALGLSRPLYREKVPDPPASDSADPQNHPAAQALYLLCPELTKECILSAHHDVPPVWTRSPWLAQALTKPSHFSHREGRWQNDWTTKVIAIVTETLLVLGAIPLPSSQASMGSSEQRTFLGADFEFAPIYDIWKLCTGWQHTHSVLLGGGSTSITRILELWASGRLGCHMMVGATPSSGQGPRMLSILQ